MKAIKELKKSDDPATVPRVHKKEKAIDNCLRRLLHQETSRASLVAAAKERKYLLDVSLEPLPQELGLGIDEATEEGESTEGYVAKTQ